MQANLVLKIFHAMLQLRNLMFLLQHLQMLFALIEFDKILNPLINACLEILQLVQRLVSEVFGRRLILLHTLQVTNDLLGTRLLLINDAFEVIEFFIDLLRDLVFQSLLITNSLLHFLAFF